MLALDGDITKTKGLREADPKMSGIDFSFVATRSGLTRWEDIRQILDPVDIQDNVQKPDIGPRATDELWYIRAVDYHHHNPDSFVISAPLDSTSRGVTTITASHAIYKEMGGGKAAAAAVGVQMDYSRLTKKFMDATKSVKTEARDDLSC